MARPVGAPHRPRLHATLDRPGSRRGPRARDHRGGGAGRHHDVRHGPRLRGQRAAARARPPASRRGGKRPGRDQGRHEPCRRRVDSRRTREGDPRRLRGQPRVARRASDRSLPHPRARPADTLADLRARTRTPRRGRPRAPRRTRERQPAAARRGARARSRGGRAGRPQPPGRSSTARRALRAVRRGGDRADRAFTARRTAPGGQPCAPRRIGRARGEPRRDARRARPCLAPRALASRRRDPGCPPAGDGALRCPRCLALARRRRPRLDRTLVPVAVTGRRGR